ncbi:MAG TPA: hypothetical protein G4O02_17040 [Caldilineae bacterium]|nr:hypothetical protein [Caldilineae bacterium]
MTRRYRRCEVGASWQQPVEELGQADIPIGLAVALKIIGMLLPPVVIVIAIVLSGAMRFQTAVLLVPVWVVLYMFASSPQLVQMLDHFMLYRIRVKEIEVQRQADMAQISMQEKVSLTQTVVAIERQDIAARALVASGTSALDGGALWDVVEQRLMDAVMQAYRLADEEGWIPNNRECPFGRRALGGAYAEITYRLANPGEKFGIIGTTPVATYDELSRRWRLNLRDYPDPAQALQALVGRRWLAA